MGNMQFALKNSGELSANKVLPWKVMIVDDEKDIHSVTELALKDVSYMNRDFEFIHAFSAKEAIEKIQMYDDIALIFMDVVMENHDSGLQAIKVIREELKNKLVRIIIRTGQPGFAPERDIVKNYEINDYKEKSELTMTKLYTSVIAAIRSYHDLVKMERLSKEIEEARVKIAGESTAKSLFIANISHELRTPLNGILGSLQVMRFDQMTPKMDRMLNMIEKSANILLDNISDIIDISRLETGKIEPVIQKFDFYDFVEKNTAPYAVTAKAKKITFTYSIDNAIPRFLSGDEGITKRVFMCILSNAVKYTEEGEIEVVISKEYADESHIRVKFAIIDTGIGVEKSKHEEIFEPFVQGDNSYTKVYQGLGLGLSVSRRFLEMLGGDIFVESDGRGSTFTFYVNMKLTI